MKDLSQPPDLKSSFISINPFLETFLQTLEDQVVSTVTKELNNIEQDMENLLRVVSKMDTTS